MDAPPLDHSQVHVWTASLDASADAVDELCTALAPDERARAERFRTPQLRRRFVVARVQLRRLLAAYASVDSSALRFGYGASGKPHLEGATDLRFNLSHAADVALIAIAARRDVGIDIEAKGRNVDVDGVAAQAFSDFERRALMALAPDARREAFFRIWTRKEAYVKARGDGLSYPTRRFSVSHSADGDALIADEQDGQARNRWRVTGLDAPPGFAAALGVEGGDWTVLRFDATQLPR